jgi:hypothetical protein
MVATTATRRAPRRPGPAHRRTAARLGLHTRAAAQQGAVPHRRCSARHLSLEECVRGLLARAGRRRGQGCAPALGAPVAIPPARGAAGGDRPARDPDHLGERSAARPLADRPASRHLRALLAAAQGEALRAARDRARPCGCVPVLDRADELPAVPVQPPDLQQLPEHGHDVLDVHLRDDGDRAEHGGRVRGSPRISATSPFMRSARTRRRGSRLPTSPATASTSTSDPSRRRASSKWAAFT